MNWLLPPFPEASELAEGEPEVESWLCIDDVHAC